MITREIYMDKIKPCFDKIYELNKENSNTAEMIIISNIIEKMLKHEFDMEGLLSIVKKATPLEKEICLKNSIDLQSLLQALEENKMDT